MDRECPYDVTALPFKVKAKTVCDYIFVLLFYNRQSLVTDCSMVLLL